MKSLDLCKLSFLNVFASPVRSVLTVLGMAIGIGAILAVLTLGDAGQSQVRTEMARLGIDKVWVTGELLRGDGELLSEKLSVSTSEQVYLPTEVQANGLSKSTTVIGCTVDYLAACDVQLLEGRMLYPLEWENPSRCALLGEHIADELHASAGDTLQIGAYAFTVCGVIESASGFSRIEIGQAVVLPLDTLCELTHNSVHEVVLDVPTHLMPQTVAAMAETVMADQRGVAVETVTMQVQIEAANSVIAIFVDVLKWVAFICILVGGIGVMNILLVSVRERRREIGIMQSLGTTRGQICVLFLLEALLYAAVGGILGILLGLGLIDVAGRSIGLYPNVRVFDCAAVLASALLVGLFFGVAPASKASKLNPVDALRSE